MRRRGPFVDHRRMPTRGPVSATVAAPSTAAFDPVVAVLLGVVGPRDRGDATREQQRRDRIGVADPGAVQAGLGRAAGEWQRGRLRRDRPHPGTAGRRRPGQERAATGGDHGARLRRFAIGPGIAGVVLAFLLERERRQERQQIGRDREPLRPRQRRGRAERSRHRADHGLDARVGRPLPCHDRAPAASAPSPAGWRECPGRARPARRRRSPLPGRARRRGPRCRSRTPAARARRRRRRARRASRVAQSPMRTGVPKAAPGAAIAAHSSRVPPPRERNDHATTASPEALMPAWTVASREWPVRPLKSVRGAPNAAAGSPPRDAGPRAGSASGCSATASSASPASETAVASDFPTPISGAASASATGPHVPPGSRTDAWMTSTASTPIASRSTGKATMPAPPGRAADCAGSSCRPRPSARPPG